MADTTETTEKKPPIVVTPNELATMYDSHREKEYEKERKAFKNPITTTLFLLHCGRLACLRIVDAFARIVAIESREEARDSRIAALEEFKAATEVQAAEALKQLEVMMAASQGSPAEAEKSKEEAKPDSAPKSDAKPEEKPAQATEGAPVVSIKRDKKKNDDKPAGGQGGAA